MLKTIQFQDDELGVIYFEVEEANTSPTRSDGMTKVGDENTRGKFEDALKTVRGIAGKLIHQIASIPQSPDEVECKIGIKFNVEAGVIIAKTSTEGNMEITLKWKKDPKSDSKPA